MTFLPPELSSLRPRPIPVHSAHESRRKDWRTSYVRSYGVESVVWKKKVRLSLVSWLLRNQRTRGTRYPVCDHSAVVTAINHTPPGFLSVVLFVVVDNAICFIYVRCSWSLSAADAEHSPRPDVCAWESRGGFWKRLLTVQPTEKNLSS